jgi:2,4-dienoyl-CoA reductase (NADPH2)
MRKRRRAENNHVHLLVGGREVSTISQPDGIVLALGTRPENSLAEEITGHTFDLHVIGDALKPRRTLDAIEEGFDIGMRL